MFKNVHGISLRPHTDAFINHIMMLCVRLPQLLRLAAARFRPSADGIFGYKGGTIERQLLMEIGMYRYDIGALGCPKTDEELAAMGAVGRLGDPCHECDSSTATLTVVEKLHRSISLNVMVAGHTKFAPGSDFGLLTQKYR